MEHRVEPRDGCEVSGDASQRAVVIVDLCSTGASVALEVYERGYAAIALNSKVGSLGLKIPQFCSHIEFQAVLDEQDTLEDTVKEIQRAAGDKTIVACICGGDPGVPLCDQLSERLGLRTNGTRIKDRRDKKIQQEVVREAGLRSIRQVCGSSIGDVEDFLRRETYPVVVKPTAGVGSSGVKLCYSYQEAKEHFELLMSVAPAHGVPCEEVLCQEFLRGKEYVVDHVSRDGVHKTVMLWCYDKRCANGSAFVYHTMDPVDSESPEAKLLIPYIRGVLDAMHFTNGPSHAEVMMTEDGPCLVEMNCRALGGNGVYVPLSKALTGGYSQVDATVDAYLDEDRFDSLPEKPPSPYKAHGTWVFLVSHSRGVVKSTPGFEAIKALPSFVKLETGICPGKQASCTVDLFTSPGYCIIMHKEKHIVDKDLAAIRSMELNNTMFEYETPSKDGKNGESSAHRVSTESEEKKEVE